MSAQGAETKVNYTLEVLADIDAAVFRWVGPISLEDRQNNTHLMSEFCKRNGVSKIIVDGREQISQTDVIDSYDFAKDVPWEMKGLTIAVVHRPDDESLPFIETVAFNRGSRTRAFTDYEEAVAWMRSLD